MTANLTDFDFNGFSPGQGTCGFKLGHSMYMMGGRMNKKAIAQLHDCYIEILPDELPEPMAFQQCVTGYNDDRVYVCGNYYDTGPSCYEYSSLFAWH